MTILIPSLAGALTVAGALTLAVGLRPAPVRHRAYIRPTGTARLRAPRRRTRRLIATGLAAGMLAWLVTGWALALVIGPVAAAGLPALLSTSSAKRRIKRLEALEEWTRSLSSVLTVGLGLEQALMATLRSTPEPIRAEVTRLIARLRARWATDEALVVFADEMDDATGDLVATYLILGARRRGAGLASVLDGLAESVSDDVRARRQIEADLAKPRAVVRWVTLISTGFLVFLAVSGSHVEPYGTGIGQLVLAALLSAYAGTLLWARRIAQGRPATRFLIADKRQATA